MDSTEHASFDCEIEPWIINPANPSNEDPNEINAALNPAVPFAVMPVAEAQNLDFNQFGPALNMTQQVPVDSQGLTSHYTSAIPRDSMPMEVTDGVNEASSASQHCSGSNMATSSGPSEADWERFKPIIKQLYAQHTLDKVIEIMKGEHGLRASKKMYKDRIRKWKIDKKVKSDEMQAIIRKQTQRARVGKKSEFSIRNSRVPVYKIDRYRKAKNLSIAEEVLKIRAPTPPGLICYTPLASPLNTPRELETPELIAKLIQDYISGSFDSKTWIVIEARDCRSTKASNNLVHEFEAIYDYAMRGVVRGRDWIAWRSLDMAMSLTERVLSAENPYLLDRLAIMIIRTVYYYRLPETSVMLLKQVSAMSAKLFTSGHPFNQIFPRMLQLGSLLLRDTWSVARQRLIDCFVRRVGKSSRTYLYLQTSGLYMHEYLDGAETLETFLTLLHGSEGVLGAMDPFSLYARIVIARHYNSKEHWKEAIEVAEALINLVQPKQSKGVTHVLAEASCIMSWAQFNLSELGRAEKNARRAISLAVSQFGWDVETVLLYMMIYEEILEAWKRPDDAAAVRRSREEIVESKVRRLRSEENERYERYLTKGGA